MFLYDVYLVFENFLIDETMVKVRGLDMGIIRALLMSFLRFTAIINKEHPRSGAILQGPLSPMGSIPSIRVVSLLP